MTDFSQVNADWTEIAVTIPAEDTDRAGDIAQMVVPYGIYIEDYSHLEEEAMEIAHIDLIDEALLQKDRTKSVIHVYISPEENPAEAVSFLKERFAAEDIPNEITSANCAEEDWINNWKKYFKTMLDMGCGSGILSVAGLLLGAESAVGVDIDPLAVKTAVANAEVNGVADRFTGICGNLAEKVSGTFDIVAANIVADVVILLTKDAPRFMKPDTVYILSGIIDTREDDVLACLAEKFELIDRRSEKGWVALAAKLR